MMLRNSDVHSLVGVLPSEVMKFRSMPLFESDQCLNLSFLQSLSSSKTEPWDWRHSLMLMNLPARLFRVELDGPNID